MPVAIAPFLLEPSRLISQRPLSGTTVVCSVLPVDSLGLVAPMDLPPSGEARAAPVGPDPLRIVGLSALMADTQGDRRIAIGLVDGPVDLQHPGLAAATIRALPLADPRTPARTDDLAAMHGTFVAGILAATICPACPLLLRTVVATEARDAAGPTAGDVACAVVECVDAGARIVNLSVAVRRADADDERALTLALDHAARRGTLVVAAAGNEATVGGSVLLRHPWVIPVAACESDGSPMAATNLGASIGRRGVMGPGTGLTGLAPGGGTTTLDGTSVATALVTGAIALSWASSPAHSGADVRWAVGRAHAGRPSTIVPPLLRATAIREALA